MIWLAAGWFIVGFGVGGFVAWRLARRAVIKHELERVRREMREDGYWV